MAKDIMFSKNIREKLKNGVSTLHNAVRYTLGPKGRNVIISQSYGAPLIVNDGVTIAKAVDLKDHFENLGAKALVEASIKTNDLVGDGTTTAIILGATLILEGLKKIDEGTNPVDLRKGLNYYLPIIIDKIKSVSNPVKSKEDIYKVAYISSGDEVVSNLIADAYEKIGINGVITLEESQGLETTLSIVDGYSYDRGYLSSYMVTSNSKKIELENPYVLIINKKISTMNELVPFLEVCINNQKPLLLICDELDQEVLSALVINKVRGIVNVVATKSPSFGDKRINMLNDIALLTNATFVQNGIEDVINLDSNKLGNAKKIIISSNETLIISNNDNYKIKEKIASLKEELIICNSEYEKKELEKRISKLSGGIAVIKAGAKTELEIKEKMLLIEDAICSTKAAVLSGITEGGGKVFFEISKFLENNFTHYPNAKEIIIKTLRQPFFQLLENAGVCYESIKEQLNINMWFDASTSEVIEYKNAKIIDPAMVLISSVTNAISIASILLTTECGIVEIEENQKIDKIEEDLL